MMSVRHIDPDGHERFFMVSSISRTPGGPLVFENEEQIDTGKVYIMNDVGLTIGYFDLGNKKQKEQTNG